MVLARTKKKPEVEDNSVLDFLNRYHTALLAVLVIAGISLRLFHFFDNRSFWIDELYLNVSTVKMSFMELLTMPMDYEQKAPLGYLWMLRLSVLLFGKQEMSLRLFSLIGGIGSLLLMVPIASYYLRSWAVLLAISIVALGEPFIYHATEAKQYSTELFASVIAIYCLVKFQNTLKLGYLLLWGFVGALLVWFSYSSIFVLAGIAMVISLNSLLNRQWREFFLRLIPFTVWLFSFAAVYYFFLRKYEDSGWLKNFFDVMYHAYMPMPPTNATELVWPVYANYTLLERNLGMLVKFGNITDYSLMQTVLRMPLLPLLLELVGVIALFRKNKYRLFILVTPILLAVVASMFKFYPFYERFILFLAPIFILLIAYGAQEVANVFTASKRKIVIPILLLFILAPLVWNAVRFTANPGKLYKKEYNREAMLYVNDRYKEGDAVYVYWTMNHAYKYYKEAYSLKYTAVGREDIRRTSTSKADYYNKIVQQLGDLSGKKRLWVINNPWLRNNIGEYPGKAPKWYHDVNFEPALSLDKKITELGAVPIDSLQLRSIDVKLYDLTNKPQ